MKKQFIVIVLVVLVSLIVDYGIRGYYYPQKDDFESSGTDGSLKKEHWKLFCKSQISNRQKAENRKREET